MTLHRKSPGLAVFLSLVPGLGHVYAGQGMKGVLLFLGTALAGFLMVIVPGVQFAFGPFAESFAGSFPGAGVFSPGWDPFRSPMAVALTAPLFVLVIGPTLVIYSMVSSHRAVLEWNAAVEAATGVGPARPMGPAGPGAPATPLPSPSRPDSASAAAPDGWAVTASQATLWGAILAALGLLLLVPHLLPGVVISAGRLWPLLLVALGVAVVWGAAGRGNGQHDVSQAPGAGRNHEAASDATAGPLAGPGGSAENAPEEGDKR